MKTILVDTLYCFTSEIGEIFTEMYSILETYPNRKILLTNANDEQFTAWKLYMMPYELFTLKHKPEKTDPTYFKKMLEHFDLLSTDVVYFEHNSKAVEAAKTVGICSYYYNSQIKDLCALKEFLDESLKR